jgi:hypothetical protein
MRGYLSAIALGATFVVVHVGCGGANSSPIMGTSCGTNPACYVTNSTGLCAIDPNAVCDDFGNWKCGPGGVLGSGCLTDGGVAPPPEAGADAGPDGSGNGTDASNNCYGGDEGIPVYCFTPDCSTQSLPTCTNSGLVCPTGTILETSCLPPPPTGYLTCMDSAGNVSSTMKTCTYDTDCMIAKEQTDCCGSSLYVGISTNQQSTFASCETAWEMHEGGCACAAFGPKTEDGKSVGNGAPQVHCVAQPTTGTATCQTYMQ